MNYLPKLNNLIQNCKDCDKADTWCDKHKKMSRHLSGLSIKLRAYIRRDEGHEAIDEVVQEMRDTLEE